MRMWAEYDGFVWCKLTIAPKKKLTLNSFGARHSDHAGIHRRDERLQLRAGGHGKTPCGREGRLAIWLGNGNGGIQWLNDCDGQLFVKNTREVVHVVPGSGEGATLHIDLVNVPTDFEKEHTIEFGFIATPTRPKIQRTWKDPDHWGLHGSIGGWYPEGQEFQVAYDNGSREGWRPYDSGIPSQSPCYSAFGLMYVTTASAKVDDADGQNFGDEWLANANTQLKGNVSTTHASKRYVNYFVWRHWNASHNRSPSVGWYFDTPNENGSSNEYAGAGYVTRDGQRASVKGILGARDLCRRMYNIVLRWYPFGYICFHTSGTMNMAYCSFCTSLLDGENFGAILGPSQPTYVNAMTPERYRAEYMGFNLCGNPNIFVGEGQMNAAAAQLMGGGDRLMDHIMGLALLHDKYPDGWIFGADAGNLERAGDRCWKVLQKHGLFSPFYDFVPYWEQKAVTPPNKDFYASFYKFRNQDIDNMKPNVFTVFNDMTPEQKKNYRKVVCIFYNHSDYEARCG